MTVDTLWIFPTELVKRNSFNNGKLCFSIQIFAVFYNEISFYANVDDFVSKLFI